MNIKPLLATPVQDYDALTFPKLASAKLDGIRCLTLPNTNPLFKCLAVSRNLKPIPNGFVRDWIEDNLAPGFDGELMVVDAEGTPLPFNEVSSGIMSRSGEPNFQYRVFDFNREWVTPCGFNDRFYELGNRYELKEFSTHLKLVEHLEIQSQAELDTFEAHCLASGFEGVMLRDPDGRYKFGRSTEKEAILLKIKRFEQSEAVVVGVEEEMHNANEKTLERGGKATRSNHAAGMVGKGTLGALVVRMGKLEFKIGSGFTAAQRLELWTAWIGGRTFPKGQVVTFKHQPSGAKEAPRFPVFIGFRHTNDL